VECWTDRGAKAEAHEQRAFDGMMEFMRQRPWIWVVAAFVALIGLWAWFITLAVRNQPEEVPLEHLPASETP
jgi:hypothetical protein